MDQYEESYEVFVNIASDEDGDVMELPAEKNGKILLSTIQAQFPDAIGLKYKSSSGGLRGIRAEDNVLDPPQSGWGDATYLITTSGALKRKSGEESSNGSSVKTRKPRSRDLLQDMIVLGLPFNATDEEVEEYFTKNCGELAFHEVKYDRTTKKPRGFGFIRFKTEEGATEALQGTHLMQGRKLEIRMSKKKENPMKLFVGRLPNGTTQEEVTEYFSEFGDLEDVFCPSPFRGFSFVTFCSEAEARSCLNETHIMKGSRLNVTPADPKPNERQQGGADNYRGGDSRGGDSRRGQGDFQGHGDSSRSRDQRDRPNRRDDSHSSDHRRSGNDRYNSRDSRESMRVHDAPRLEDGAGAGALNGLEMDSKVASMLLTLLNTQR